MDRRPRDIPPEDRYGGGQSYRPGNVRNRSPPPRRDRDDAGFNGRSPPRRGPGPPLRGRSRSPIGRELFRRRSPSPPRERFGVPRGGDSYRARSRTPPRRDDDLFRRESDGNQGRDSRDDRDFRDGRRFGGEDRTFRDNRPAYGRSPPRNARDRSPLPFKGDRERSPVSARGRRSPLPVRSRFSPPPQRFDDFPPSRPRSPPRRGGFSPRGSDREYPSRPRSPISRNDAPSTSNAQADGWRRPGSPSAGDGRRDRDFDRGRESIATSRRSSPPLHSSRLTLMQQDHEGPRSGRPSPRSNYGEAQSRTPVRSSPRRLASPAKDKDGDTSMADSSNVRDDRRPESYNRSAADDEADNRRAPPSGPRDSRPPPTAPRGPSGASVIPPAGPRGDMLAGRGGFSHRGRGSYTTDFTGRGRGAPSTPYQSDRGAAPPFSRGASYERDAAYATPAALPSGPRNFSGPSPRPGISRAPSALSTGRYEPAADPPREPRNGPAPVNPYRRPTDAGIIPLGPASDRSRDLRRVDSGVHPALRDLPEVVTNGRKLPPPVDHTRLNKLEEESEKLRKAIQEKDARKRKGLREWDRLVREGESAAFRSEVAEESVRAYELEAESTGMAF